MQTQRLNYLRSHSPSFFHPVLYSPSWFILFWLPLPASFPRLKIVVWAAANVLDDNCFCDLLEILPIFRPGKIKKSLRSLGISLLEILFNLPVYPFSALSWCSMLQWELWKIPSAVFFLLTGSILKPCSFIFICVLSCFSHVQLFETL